MKIKESDLFTPVKSYLEGLGFQVFGEVKGCDLCARYKDELVVVELKLRLNLQLLLQAADRLELSDNVYIGVYQPTKRSYPKEWKRLRKLLIRVGIGVLFVRKLRSGWHVESALEPSARELRKRPKRKMGIMKEMEARKLNTTKGGVTGEAIMTAYREETIYIAHLLSQRENGSPKEIKALGGSGKTGQILYANHYGWFIREGKGCYSLSPRGKEALKGYKGLIEKLLLGSS